MSAAEPRDPGSLAEEAFGDYLARNERGAGLSFDEFCRGHAGLEGELRALRARWEELAGIREQLDAAGSDYRASSGAARLEAPAVTLDSRLLRGVGAPPDLIERLKGRSAGFERYRVEREIGRGGMGRVLRVWDPDLRRTLAMKVVRGEGLPGGSIDPRLLSRFLEEAQISGQLDHPGIVPLHEIGMAPDGEVYFTMKLVHGENLGQIFTRCRRGEEGWTRPRVVGVLQKVCEAVAYAHAKGVLHRDLKPTNVMVGHFGEVYVMDWGLARILGTPARERADGARVQVATDRAEASDSNPDSPVFTVEGDVIGTPAYMSPEQALGARADLGPRADVYSLGAMLYQHLAGTVPYVRPGESIDGRSLVERVRKGPPASLERVAPEVPAELVAICERAMARSPTDRYEGVAELGDDLRAFLEGRVVRAYRTGAAIELRKWIARNRSLAATAVLLALALVGGLLASTSLLVDVRASESRLMRMSDVKRALDLRARAERLFPAYPERVRDYEDWLAEAERLLDRLPVHRATLAELRRGARELSEDERLAEQLSHPQRAYLESQQQRAREIESWIEGIDSDDPELLRAFRHAHLETHELPSRATLAAALDELREFLAPTVEEVGRRRTWVVGSTERQWEHDTLAALVHDLDDLADPERGLLREMRARLAMARAIAGLSVSGADASARWAEARASIGDPSRCALYRGLQLEPQMGLLPIGQDPASGLWEFALVQSGEIPQRDARGELVIDEESALVFVLVPGGSFWMGAQAGDPQGRNYDPLAQPEEAPVHEVRLDPFFLSKYEMTQAQWERVEGTRPSYYVAGNFTGGLEITGRHPVEQISWHDAARVLPHLGLVLPSEAQWEHAARAFLETPWFDGLEKEALTDAANLCDAAAERAGMPWGGFDEWLDDGYAIHAPVGSLRPNPWGLHDLYGNVLEHCRDYYGTYTRSVLPGTGERVGWSHNRVLRGGSFDVTHPLARAAARSPVTSGFNGFNVGVRPARSLP